VKRRTKFSPPRTPRMFAEPAAEIPKETYVAHIDGASRGNPGPSAYAALIRRPDGTLVCSLKKYLGRTTNNVAEYAALISALDYTTEHGIRRLRVRSDSQLLVQQMRGLYRVRSAVLAPMHERASKQAATLEYFSIEHIPREQNREADRLANAILDETEGKPVAGAGKGETRKSNPPVADETRRIRARYSGGALHPLDQLELAEGEEVEIAIRRRSGE